MLIGGGLGRYKKIVGEKNKGGRGVIKKGCNGKNSSRIVLGEGRCQDTTLDAGHAEGSDARVPGRTTYRGRKQRKPNGWREHEGN